MESIIGRRRRGRPPPGLLPAVAGLTAYSVSAPCSAAGGSSFGIPSRPTWSKRLRPPESRCGSTSPRARINRPTIAPASRRSSAQPSAAILRPVVPCLGCGTTLIRWLPVADFPYSTPQPRRILLLVASILFLLDRADVGRQRGEQAPPRRRPCRSDKLREEIRKLRIENDRPAAITLLLSMAPSLAAAAAIATVGGELVEASARSRGGSASPTASSTRRTACGSSDANFASIVADLGSDSPSLRPVPPRRWPSTWTTATPSSVENVVRVVIANLKADHSPVVHRLLVGCSAAP